jgi:hypothetical protein
MDVCPGSPPPGGSPSNEQQDASVLMNLANSPARAVTATGSPSRKPAPKKRDVLSVQEGRPGVLVLSYADLKKPGPGQRTRGMALPANTLECLDFVRQDPLLGGVDMWQSSLVFRQEKDAGFYGIDYVVFYYVGYPDGEPPATATWRVPECAVCSSEAQFGEIVGYATYGFIDCGDWDIRAEHKAVLKNTLRLSQVVMKPSASVSQYDRCLKQLLNQLAPRCEYLLAEPIPAHYRAYQQTGIRWTRDEDRLQPLSTETIEQIFGTALSVYRTQYCTFDPNGEYPTLVFPITGLTPEETHPTNGMRFRILTQEDELEIISIPRGVNKADLVKDIYWGTGVRGATKDGLTFLTCRCKRRTVTMDIMSECFGEPSMQLSCNCFVWDSEYLPSRYQEPQIANVQIVPSRRQVSGLVNTDSHLPSATDEAQEPAAADDAAAPMHVEPESPVYNLADKENGDAKTIKVASVEFGEAAKAIGLKDWPKIRIARTDKHEVFGIIQEDGIQQLAQFCKTLKNPVFVDLGCGVGNVLVPMEAVEIPSFGIESNDDYVDYGRQLLPQFKLPGDRIVHGSFNDQAKWEVLRGDIAKCFDLDAEPFTMVCFAHTENFDKASVQKMAMQHLGMGEYLITLDMLPMAEDSARTRHSEFGGRDVQADGQLLREERKVCDATKVAGYGNDKVIAGYGDAKNTMRDFYIYRKEYDDQTEHKPHAIQPSSSVAPDAVYDVAPQAQHPTMRIDSDEDAAQVEPAVPPPPPKYKVHNRVRVKYPEDNHYYPATITGAPSTRATTYSYTITWDDGDPQYTTACELDIIPISVAPTKPTKKAAKRQKTGAKLVTVETHTGEVRYKGPRSYSCALQCWFVICHAFDCDHIAQYLMHKFAKRSKGAQLDMYKVATALTELAYMRTDTQKPHLAMVAEPPEDQVPLYQRKGGPVVYALHQRGVFIFVTSPYPARTVAGEQVNHAVIYVKLGNSRGATGSQCGTHSCLPPYRGTA